MCFVLEAMEEVACLVPCTIDWSRTPPGAHELPHLIPQTAELAVVANGEFRGNQMKE